MSYAMTLLENVAGRLKTELRKSLEGLLAGADALPPSLTEPAALAGAATALRQQPVIALLSPIVVAIALGEALRNYAWIPSANARLGVAFTTLLLTSGLAAMKLETDFARLRARGPPPLALGLGASLFIAAVGLFFVKAIVRL